MRMHSTPRKSLFTPCRVPRGPAHPEELSAHQRTAGIDMNGQSFKIQDDWTDAEDSHRVFELPWTGTATFMSKKWSTLRKRGATDADHARTTTTHTYLHTHTLTHIHTLHSYMCTYIHAHIHAYIDTCTHACIHYMHT